MYRYVPDVYNKLQNKQLMQKTIDISMSII